MLRENLEARVRTALDATPFGGRQIQARRARRSRLAGPVPDAFVADLDFELAAKVHGVKFLDRDRIAVPVGSAPTGVRFFDLASGRPSIHVDRARKTQDVAFVSEREMIVIAVHGVPRRRRQQADGSDVCRVRFDLASGHSEIGPLRTFRGDAQRGDER